MKNLRNKFLLLLFLVLLTIPIIIFTGKEKIRFDMSTGRSWEERFIFGMKIASSEINPCVYKYATFFELPKKDYPSITIEVDRNLLFVRFYSYSHTKSDYYDLVSTAKILDKVSNSDDLYIDERKNFLRLWNDLSMSRMSGVK